MESQSSLLLKRQLKGLFSSTHQIELLKAPVHGFSAGLVSDDNLYEWDILILGPEGTYYEGGFYKARLKFPTDYPSNPPKMTFITEIWHPNIHTNGEVCISILHAPGDDQFGYEKSGERWLPVHTVESIVISVISMLSSPNDESPANLECAKQMRDDLAAFKKKCRKLARQSTDNEM